MAEAPRLGWQPQKLVFLGVEGFSYRRFPLPAETADKYDKQCLRHIASASAH